MRAPRVMLPEPRSVRAGVAVGIALGLALGLAWSGGARAWAAPRGQDVIVPVEHGGAVDWTRGLVIAKGAAPGDIRAPSPELARVGAERRARVQAHERLLAAARAVRIVHAGRDRLVGELADADAAVAERLAAAVTRALDLAVDYGSDGSVVLSAGLPLEAVRLAVAPAPAASALAGAEAAPARPSAIIVDARSVLDAPVLGPVLVAGDHEYAGPAVFHRGVRAAAADARRGPHPVRARARAVRDGRLVVALSAPELAAAKAARALVIVVIGKP